MNHNRKSQDAQTPAQGLRVKTAIKAGGLEYDFSTNPSGTGGGTCQPPSLS